MTCTRSWVQQIGLRHSQTGQARSCFNDTLKHFLSLHSSARHYWEATASAQGAGPMNRTMKTVASPEQRLRGNSVRGANTDARLKTSCHVSEHTGNCSSGLFGHLRAFRHKHQASDTYFVSQFSGTSQRIGSDF